MNTIYVRRSIRTFLDKPVEQEKLNQIIKAGMNAPSAVNQQPWQFVIIDERSIIDEVVKVHPHALPAQRAPVSILVCGDPQKERSKGYWPIDCAAAVQNMLLMITDLGLGGCWLGIYPRENRVKRLQELLGTPSEIIPFALIAVGYPAEEKEPKELFDAQRIHYNRWENHVDT